MSELIIPRKFYNQPQGAVAVAAEWRTPGSVAWIATKRKNNLSGGVDGTIYLESSYGVSWAANANGICMLPDVGHSRCISFQAALDAPKFTALINFRLRTNAAPSNGIMQYASAVSSAFPRLLVQARPDGGIYLYCGGSYVITDAGGAAAILGKPTSILVRYDGSKIHYYRPGAYLSATVGATNSASRIWFGNGYSASGDVEINLGYFSATDIGNAASLSLIANPWQIFKVSE
jgi:hypothetical protein